MIAQNNKIAARVYCKKVGFIHNFMFVVMILTFFALDFTIGDQNLVQRSLTPAD